MAKRKTKLTIRIPPYEPPRNTWRQKIHRIALFEAEKAEISYRSTDKLKLKVRLYLKDGALFSNDLDNRLKDIMDALKKKGSGSGLRYCNFSLESSIKKLAYSNADCRIRIAELRIQNTIHALKAECRI